jgi:hypothetical protein
MTHNSETRPDNSESYSEPCRAILPSKNGGRAPVLNNALSAAIVDMSARQSVGYVQPNIDTKGS